MTDVLGRYAPSPSGAQHLGNVRTAVLAWADARRRGGRCALRVDDLDAPRIVAGSEAQIREELTWLGLSFEPLPETHPACRQSLRTARYRVLLDRLIAEGAAYPCALSSKAYRACQSAPHGDGALAPTTSEQQAQWWDSFRRCPENPVSWRFCRNDISTEFFDDFQGVQRQKSGDEFVLWRSDEVPSYQLANVVDDHDLGVTRVVRGADLVESTHRQLQILEVLGWHPPTYAHVGLVTAADGKRLAKRHGWPGLAALRQGGLTADQILGWVVASLGGADRPLDAAAVLEALPDSGWGLPATGVDPHRLWA
jgi:glutamyl-tRNA synthetase